MKKSSLLLLLLFLSFFCIAQRSEVGTLMGTSFYFGDLNNMPFRNSEFAGGLIYRYNFTPRVALKANILFGTITASDEKNNHSILKDADGKYLWDFTDRKLSFTSPISEISAQVELNFFNIYNVGHKNLISPYIFSGIAFFSFNPKAMCPIDSQVYDLQPIGTEGQKKKYALTGFAIPFGIGFKANIGRFICIGAEWGLRFTFTNYLDDVGGLYYEFPDSKEIEKYFADPAQIHTPGSQRYSTRKTDWYSFAGVIITIRIGNEDRICDIKTNVKLKHKRRR